MERSVLGIRLSDRVRNTLIRSKAGIAHVGNKTARVKWDWAGYICRMHQDRWARVITQWVPKDGGVAEEALENAGVITSMH